MERFSSVLIELLRRVFQRVGPLVEIANLVDFRLKLGILKLLFAKFVGYLCFIFVNISSYIVGDNLLRFKH